MAKAKKDIFSNFKTTEEIPVPPKLVDHVIGQDRAVEIIKKAANQRRHILLVGEPGTGKSMLGQAMSELLPVEELKDVLIHPNLSEKNYPRIEVVKAGEGEKVVERFRIQKKKAEAPINFLFKLLFFGIIFLVIYYSIVSGPMVLFGGIIAAVFLLMGRQYIKVKEDILVPKLLINNSREKKAPFIDATGSHAGALLGDVRHDPFQSGGLETPPHELIEGGAVHRANGGVLFIDEISILEMRSQQEILSALQDKELSITGRSERSSGAMVRTQPVPCDFVLVAAGNLEAMKGLHPALRSRITGYGYEIYMHDVMDDTKENRKNLIQFVAQEVTKDGKIPHFSREAVEEMIKEAGRRAGRKGKLTIALRSLGGLIRAAGDVARSENAEVVEKKHVVAAKSVAKSLEQQIADRYISRKKDYRVFDVEGQEVGRVNGLAVIGDSGVILPIVAEVVPALSRDEGKMIATGKLKTIAREAVQNVSALVKKHTGKDISNYDIHVQFLQTYEGVEGDSASVSVAAAVISALEGVPVDQRVAMTGSLSVRGDVLPVGGVTPKVEAAISAGIKTVIIPVGNSRDVMIDKKALEKVEIVYVKNLNQVLENALVWKGKEGLLKKIQEVVPAAATSLKGLATAKKHEA